MQLKEFSFCRKCLFFIGLCCTLLPDTTNSKDLSIDYEALFTHNDYPLIACNAEELTCLRQAMVLTNEAGKIIFQRVNSAQKQLSNSVSYPPRGGRHNQWYQCDKCQVALTKIDNEHHKCPICNKIYSGEPYDDVLFSSIHYSNFERLFNSAWSYALTAKEAFAQDAINIMTDYAKLYLTYPKRGNTKWNLPYAMLTGARLADQTLDEAYLFATKIAPAFDLVYNSSIFSEEDKVLIKEKFFTPMLENIKQNWANAGNWQSWHNAALFMGGILLKRKDFLEHSLYHPQNGFFAQMEKCVSQDGMWFENSWGYHFYALQALTLQAEAARRVNIDLWQNQKLKKMFLLPLMMTMPDGTLPRFGDDVSTAPSQQSHLYECAFNAYKDANIKSILPDKPSFYSVMFNRKIYDTTEPYKKIKLPSVAFTNSGYVILRTYGEKDLTVAATFSPFGGYHGHFDKLSFVFFGYSKELGVDPGRAASQAYRLPIHKTWYRATISHNSVLVDGRSQKGAGANLDYFFFTNNLAIAVLSCNKHYDDVEQKRFFVLTENYLIVLDRLKSNKQRTFDWFYHNRATNLVISTRLTDSFHKPTDIGWEYINCITGGIATSTIKTVFEGQKSSVKLIISDGGKLFAGDGPGSSIKERIPLIAVRKIGNDVMFLSCIEPSTNALFSVEDINWQRTNGNIRLKIHTSSKIDEFECSDDIIVNPLK